MKKGYLITRVGEGKAMRITKSGIKQIPLVHYVKENGHGVEYSIPESEFTGRDYQKTSMSLPFWKVIYLHIKIRLNNWKAI
jgi:hypothetical protein